MPAIRLTIPYNERAKMEIERSKQDTSKPMNVSEQHQPSIIAGNFLPLFHFLILPISLDLKDLTSEFTRVSPPPPSPSSDFTNAVMTSQIPSWDNTNPSVISQVPQTRDPNFLAKTSLIILAY